jgi:hypothetical protein
MMIGSSFMPIAMFCISGIAPALPRVSPALDTIVYRPGKSPATVLSAGRF